MLHSSTAHSLIDVHRAPAADSFMQAWSEAAWITDSAAMPAPPQNLDEMYLVHMAMQNHVLADSCFGGLAGYKLGAVGVIPGEAAISAPLFKRFVVDASSNQVSAAAINLHNLEAEVAIIMGRYYAKKIPLLRAPVL